MIKQLSILYKKFLTLLLILQVIPVVSQVALPDIYYRLELQSQQLAKLGLPSDALQVINQFNLTSNPILYSTTIARTTLEGIQLLPGETIVTGVNLDNFLQQVASYVPVPKSLLAGTTLQANIPFTYKNRSDMTVHIGAATSAQQEEPLTLSGLLKTIGLDEMDLGDDLIDQLDEINVRPTSYGINMYQDQLRYALNANVDLFSVQNIAMQLHMEPATKAHKGTPRSAITFTIPATNFGLGEISEHLKPFDETVTLNNPSITFANYDSDTDNTIDGIIITSVANFGPPFNALLAPDGSKDQITVQVKIPRNMQSAEDVSVNITSSAMHLDKICLSQLLETLGSSVEGGPMDDLAAKICLTNADLNVRLVANDSALELHGTLNLLGQSQLATIYLQKRETGIGVTFATNTRSSTAISFASLADALKDFDSFGTISNWRIAFSNWLNPDDVIGFGDPTIEGFSMTGTMKFTGYVGKFLNIFGLQEEEFELQVATGKENQGITLKVQKGIDTSVGGNFLQFKTLILGIKIAAQAAPEVSVSLAGTSTFPGCGEHAFELEGELAPGEVTLQGAIVQEESAGEDEGPSATLQILKTNLYIEKPTISISLAEGALIGFGGGGTLQLGNKEFTVYTKVNMEQPTKLALMFAAQDVGLNDVFNFWPAIIGKSSTQINLPNIFKFDDFTAHYAPVEVIMPNEVIPEGFGAQGTMSFFGSTFDINVSYSLAGATAKAIADKPVEITPAIILSDASGSKGPEIDLELNFSNQQAIVRGKLQLLGGLISSNANITITPTGFATSLTDTVAGLNMNLAIAGNIEALMQKNLNEWFITGTVTNNLSAAIEQAAQETISAVFAGPNAAQQEAAQLCQDLFGYLKVFSFNCTSCLASATGLGITETMIQQVVQAAQISIDSIAINTNLGQLAQGTALTLTVHATIFGEQETLQVPVDLAKPQNTLTAALLDALKVVLTPAKVLQHAAVHMADALKFSCSSSMNLGNSQAIAAVSIEGSNPLASYVHVTASELALTDIVEIGTQAIQSATGKSLGIPSNLTAIAPLTFNNVAFTFNPSQINFTGEIALLGLEAVQASGKISRNGITIQATLPALNIPGLLQLNNPVNTTQGAQLAITLTDAKQEATIQGQLTLLTLLSDAVNIQLSATPQMTFTSTLMGLTCDGTLADFDWHAGNFTNATLQLSLNATELTQAVQQGITSAEAIINAPLQKAENAMGDLQSTCNRIPLSCIACAPLGLAQSALQAAQTIADGPLNELKSFSINSITLQGSLAALNLKNGTLTAPTMAINYTLQGSTNTMTLTSIACTSINDIVPQVINQLFNPVHVAQEITAKAADLIQGNFLLQASKDVGEAIKNVGECATQQLEAALKEGLQEAEKVGGQIVQGLDDVGKNVAQDLEKAKEAAQQAAQAAQEAIQDAQKAAQAAEQAITQAEQAAQQAVQAAEKAVQQAAQAVAQAIQQATQAVAKAAQEAANAAKEAAESVAHTAKKAWHSFTSLF